MAFIDIANEADVIEGKILTVNTKFGPVALSRINGSIYAFEDRCSHDDAPLESGSIEGKEVICPRHGARFNICTGAAMKLPATEDIETFPVKIENGRVEVEID